MKLFHLGICCALALAFTGCGGGKPADKPVTKIDIPATPEGTAQAIQKATADGKLEVYWQALPAKHQGDVKAVLVLAGEKLDPEVYNGAMGLLNKLVTVAKAKQEFILNNEQVKSTAKDEAAAKAQLTAGINLLETIVNSDLKTVDGLKTLNPEQFLANVGAAVAETSKAVSNATGKANELEKMKTAKISVEKSEGDKATLKLEVEGETAKPIELVKVDGKWVPADMVNGWDKNIADAKAALSDFKLTEAQKKQALDGIKAIDEVLTTFNDAKTQKEFDDAVGASMFKVLGAVGPLMGGGGPPGGGFGPGDGPGQPPDFGAPPPNFGAPPEEGKDEGKEESNEEGNQDDK